MDAPNIWEGRKWEREDLHSITDDELEDLVSKLEAEVFGHAH